MEPQSELQDVTRQIAQLLGKLEQLYAAQSRLFQEMQRRELEGRSRYGPEQAYSPWLVIAVLVGAVAFGLFYLALTLVGPSLQRFSQILPWWFWVLTAITALLAVAGTVAIIGGLMETFPSASGFVRSFFQGRKRQHTQPSAYDTAITADKATKP
jgi:hypothetical protein